MSQMAERLHARERRPEMAPRRVIEAQAPRAMVQLRSRGGAPATTRVTAPVSEAARKQASESVAAGPARLPPRLRTGVEALSGLAMDDVRVHRNSSEPAKLGALAFTRGSDIHLGPGQEEHLPHEAWHVVQQKQGQVKATAQLKGVAVNDDAGLESEADRMARRLTDGPHRPGPTAERPSKAAVPVVQAKLQWKGVPLEEKDKAYPAYSAVTKKFIARKESFLLRDDVSPTAKEIHILHMGKKYLLGEIHESGVWEQETKPWQVTKLTEAYSKIPQETEDVHGDFKRSYAHYQAHSQLKAEPLESSHPKILTSVLSAIQDVEGLLERMAVDDETQPGRWTMWTRFILDDLAGIRFAYNDEYQVFHDTFENSLKPRLWDPATKTHRPAPPRLAKIYSVSAKLRSGYERNGNFTRLARSIDAIKAEMASAKVAKKGWAKRVAAQIGEDLDFLAGLAKELIAIVAEGRPKEAELLKGLLPVPGARPYRDVHAVMDPIRERGMAENIGNTAPPVLVQLGDDHVEPVWKLVGIDVAVLIPASRRLADVTSES